MFPSKILHQIERFSSKKKSLSILLGLIFVPVVANALPRSEVVVGYELEFTDNLFATEENKERSTAQAVTGELSLEDFEGSLLYETDLDFRYLSYLDSDVDDRLQATGSVNTEWFFIPKQLSWVFDNAIVEQRVDPLSGSSPLNIEWVNSMSTGPVWILRPSERNIIELTARYERVDYEESIEDESESVLGNIEWVRIISPLLDIGLGAQASERQDFGVDEFTEEKQSAYAFFDNEFKNAQLYLAGGATRITVDDFEDEFATVDGRWTHSWTPTLEFQLLAERAVVSGSDLLLDSEDFLEGAEPGAEPNPQIPVFEDFESILLFIETLDGRSVIRDSKSASLTKTQGLWSTTLTAYEIDSEQINPLNVEIVENYRGISLATGFSFSTRFNAGARISAERRESTELGIQRNIDEHRLLFESTYYLWSNLAVNGALQFERFQGDTLETDNINIMTLLFGVEYQLR
ncbi:MAG: hypothetical protein V4629_01505 [Pseudomonadota bacterium]